MRKRKQKAGKPYVYAVHGIRTHAEWQTHLQALIERELGVGTGYKNYGRFPTSKFFFPGSHIADILTHIRNDIVQLTKSGHDLTVVAHSFGAYLVHKILLENPDIKIDNLFLCGAVIPRQSRWTDLKLVSRQIRGDIVNHCGTRDPWPVLAELISPRYGATGVEGLGTIVARDVYHNFGHSGFFKEEFYKDYLFPVINGKPRPKNDGIHRFSFLVRCLLYFSSHRATTILILITAILAITSTIWVRPEALCKILSCYISASVNVDLRPFSADQTAQGKIGHVREARSSYDFNFEPSMGTKVRFKICPELNRQVEVHDLGYRGDRSDLTPSRTVQIVDTLDCSGAEKAPSPSPYREHDISVNGKQANFVWRYEGGGATPGTVSFAAAYRVRDLRIFLRVPEGVKLQACGGGSSYEVGLLPISLRKSGKCSLYGGEALICKNLNLGPGERVTYRFGLVNWFGDGEVTPCPPERTP